MEQKSYKIFKILLFSATAFLAILFFYGTSAIMAPPAAADGIAGNADSAEETPGPNDNEYDPNDTGDGWSGIPYARTYTIKSAFKDVAGVRTEAPSPMGLAATAVLAGDNVTVSERLTKQWEKIKSPCLMDEASISDTAMYDKSLPEETPGNLFITRKPILRFEQYVYHVQDAAGNAVPSRTGFGVEWKNGDPIGDAVYDCQGKVEAGAGWAECPSELPTTQKVYGPYGQSLPPNGKTIPLDANTQYKVMKWNNSLLSDDAPDWNHSQDEYKYKRFRLAKKNQEQGGETLEEKFGTDENIIDAARDCDGWKGEYLKNTVYTIGDSVGSYVNKIESPGWECFWGVTGKYTARHTKETGNVWSDQTVEKEIPKKKKWQGCKDTTIAQEPLYENFACRPDLSDLEHPQLKLINPVASQSDEDPGVANFWSNVLTPDSWWPSAEYPDGCYIPPPECKVEPVVVKSDILASGAKNSILFGPLKLKGFSAREIPPDATLSVKSEPLSIPEDMINPLESPPDDKYAYKGNPTGKGSSDPYSSNLSLDGSETFTETRRENTPDGINIYFDKPVEINFYAPYNNLKLKPRVKITGTITWQMNENIVKTRSYVRQPPTVAPDPTAAALGSEYLWGDASRNFSVDPPTRRYPVSCQTDTTVNFDVATLVPSG